VALRNSRISVAASAVDRSSQIGKFPALKARQPREGFVQFHLNGFEPGDPEIKNPAQRAVASGSSGPAPAEVDILVVGCGPAGLTLAAQLSAFADIKTCIVEQKPGPLLRGQADGVACRTMEMFEAFGFSERVLKEACWINETTFWKPDPAQPQNILRSGWVRDTEDGLSEFPHVVLNQARVHDFYLDIMRKSPSRLEPYYARRLLDLQIDPAGATAGKSFSGSNTLLKKFVREYMATSATISMTFASV